MALNVISGGKGKATHTPAKFGFVCFDGIDGGKVWVRADTIVALEDAMDESGPHTDDECVGCAVICVTEGATVELDITQTGSEAIKMILPVLADLPLAG